MRERKWRRWADLERLRYDEKDFFSPVAVDRSEWAVAVGTEAVEAVEDTTEICALYR